jgi:hypothetical protein
VGAIDLKLDPEDESLKAKGGIPFENTPCFDRTSDPEEKLPAILFPI